MFLQIYSIFAKVKYLTLTGIEISHLNITSEKHALIKFRHDKDYTFRLDRSNLYPHKNSCAFSLSTYKEDDGHGVFDVCKMNGTIILNSGTKFIIKGDEIKTEKISAKKIIYLKLFFINDYPIVEMNKDKDIYNQTVEIFKAAQEIIENQDWGDLKLKLVINGIMNMDTAKMTSWDVYNSDIITSSRHKLSKTEMIIQQYLNDRIPIPKVINNEKNTDKNKDGAESQDLTKDSNANRLKFPEGAININFNAEKTSKEIKTLNGVKTTANIKNEPFGLVSDILDKETAKKLIQIGTRTEKSTNALLNFEIGKHESVIGEYELISKYISEINDSPIICYNTETIAAMNLYNERISSNELKDFADYFSTIKNDPNNYGSLVSTSNLIILIKDKNDNASIEGLTFIGGACSTNDCFSILKLKDSDSKFYHGKVLAHEILHSLNARHDVKNNFLMEKQGCTMCMEDERNISDKTKQQVIEFINKSDPKCFEAKNTCGNGILDSSKECDSGNIFGSKCCTPDCNLKPQAQCEDLNGKCCKDCKLLKKGVQCRAKSQKIYEYECDETDVCDGISPYCQDIKKPDLTKCSHGICKKGFCQNRQLICERIDRKFSEKCDMVNECKLVCVDKSNSCNLMGNIMAGLAEPLSLPDGFPCSKNYRSGSCFNGECEVKNYIWRYVLPILFVGLVMVLVLIILLGFLP